MCDGAGDVDLLAEPESAGNPRLIAAGLGRMAGSRGDVLAELVVDMMLGS